MIVLSGADVVLPHRTLSPGTVVIDGSRIVEVKAGVLEGTAGTRVDLHDHYLIPGFIDVHVHGLEGRDTLDLPDAIRAIARGLPRYGVTAFCPTTVACPPAALRQVLGAVREARLARPSQSARVLPAHLESNFINDEYRGAQPGECLRRPPIPLPAADLASTRGDVRTGPPAGQDAEFSGADILGEIERGRPDVGIVTLAPELDGALDLVRRLAGAGIRVSLGHSGASFDQAVDAVRAGARHATHLFNRMPPVGHREPGLAGAVLESDEVAAEIICDAHHVHPAMVRVAVAAKGPARIMAITDGTAGSGLAAGAQASLGGRPITVRDSAAYLDDGTLAGSVLTMDRGFRVLVGRVGLSLGDAVLLSSTTPARELGLLGHGVIAAGAVADLVVLDRDLNVVDTYVNGGLAFSGRH